MGVSAFLITLNEENRIGRTLDSLKWTDEQVVVDAGSSDHTVAICRMKGAQVYHRPFDHFDAQKNYALSLTNQKWVLSIDADEVVTPALMQEIKKVVAENGPYTGYLIRRRNHFLGRPLRFGNQRREKILRLFHKQGAKFVGIVHETVHIDGSIGTLENVLEHFGTETIDDYYVKLKLYIDLEVNQIIASGCPPSLAKAILFPPAKWTLEYVFLGGFLDGWIGLLYHGLSCYYGWLKNFKAFCQMKRISRGEEKGLH